MNLSQFEALDAVATFGSFSKAAERLRRNQPALSKSIQAFEAELGILLFDRTPGGAKLTEAGERMLRRARSVLAGVDVLREEAAAILGSKGGSVRVGVSPAAATTILPAACKRFLSRYPEAELDIIPSLFPKSAEQLRDATLDVVIGPVPEKHGADLLVEDLFQMPVEIVTHCDHPKRQTTNLSDLTGERWIVHGPAEGPSSLFAAPWETTGIDLPKAQLRCHSIAATLALLKPLNAFCVLSRAVYLHHAEQADIAAVPIAAPMTAFRMSLSTLRNRAPTPAALFLSDCIRAASLAANKSGSDHP